MRKPSCLISWTEETEACFIVRDLNGAGLAYVHLEQVLGRLIE